MIAMRSRPRITRACLVLPFSMSPWPGRAAGASKARKLVVGDGCDGLGIKNATLERSPSRYL